MHTHSLISIQSVAASTLQLHSYRVTTHTIVALATEFEISTAWSFIGKKKQKQKLTLLELL